jgi:pyridoxine 5-phosphate synthase
VTQLSVNLNKIALLRNSRGGPRPNVEAFARRAIARGAHGITVHPRPDERHVRAADVHDLAHLLASFPDIELNIEGHPDPRLLDLVLATKPAQCTLVPDAPGQLTSDHGWDVARTRPLTSTIERLKSASVRVSLFVDPDPDPISAAADAGADRIELYTGPYAHAFGTPTGAEVLARHTRAAEHAAHLGLGVNAGHDLDLDNLAPYLRAVPGVLEVSIGHAIVCDALDLGFEATLDRYLAIVSGS